MIGHCELVTDGTSASNSEPLIKGVCDCQVR